MRTLLFAAVVGGILAAPAHADPPNPVQCKPASSATVCRYADGSVQICYAMFGCHPVNEQLAPGFWD